jgi:hypothetical protein
MFRLSWLRTVVLVAALAVAGAVVVPSAVFAKDGGGSSGSGGGSSGSGGGSSGHGGGNSGHGGDDGGGDDGGHDDGDHGGGGKDDGGHGGDNSGRGNGGGGGGGGSGPSRNRGGDGWSSGSSEARGAVSRGVAVPLNRVIPMVRQAVPGRVLDVDLQQGAGGGWVYKLLVLDAEGEYNEVTVDALRNRIIRVRER